MRESFCLILPIVFIFLLSNSGCFSPEFEEVPISSISEDKPVHLEIDDSVEHYQYDLSAVFDSVSFVRLSSDSSALVSFISQVLVKDSLIFVVDCFTTSSVKRFSMTGTYLGDVGRKGRGPGEYVQPTFVEIKDNEVIVWDQYTQRLTYYDLAGRYMKHLDINRFSLKFRQFDSNRIMFNSVNSDNQAPIRDYTLFVCDSLSNLVSRGMRRKKETYDSMWYFHNFFSKDDSLFYHPVYCDTIYSILPDYTAKASYYIDFGEKAVPERLRSGKHRKELQQEQSGTRFSFLLGDFYLMDDYLLFKYTIQHKEYTGLYSSRTNKLVTFHSFSAVDPHFLPVLFNNISTSTKDAFVGYFFPAQMTSITSTVNPAEREDWEKLLGKERTELLYSMKSDDNPIITFFYPSF